MKTFTFVHDGAAGRGEEQGGPIVVVVEAKNKKSAIHKLAVKMHKFEPNWWSDSPEEYKDDLASGNWYMANLIK